MKLLQTFIILLFTLHLHSAIVVPKYFADHMVIQKNQDFKIFGYATLEEEVSILFDEMTYVTEVIDGKWEIILPGQNAGESYQIIIKGTNEIVLNDIQFGDVFITMLGNEVNTLTKNLKKSDYELSKSDYPQIRMIKLSYTDAETPQDTLAVSNQWQLCDASVAGGYSAISFMIARSLHVKHNIPIGIIELSNENTSLESWMKSNSLKDIEEKSGFQNEKKLNGTHYNSLIHPLKGNSFAGIIWSGGKTNASNLNYYDTKFVRFIEGIRNDLNNPRLPFVFVQVMQKKDTTHIIENKAIPELRTKQLAALLLENTAMVNTIDLVSQDYGDQISEKAIAERMIYPLECMVYGKCVNFHAPTPDKITINDEGYVIEFDNVDNTLMALYDEIIEGFEVPDPSGQLIPAKGKIIASNQIQIFSNHPMTGMVRYLWSANPKKVQLFNSLGNPAIPFEIFAEL